VKEAHKQGDWTMNNSAQYQKELARAKANLVDLQERGAAAIGESWDDVRNELYTPEEIAASDLRVEMMIELVRARKELRIT
jgi:ribulose-5-phosphate 4-epimerase/fuculose-1-phosphate aldolase